MQTVRAADGLPLHLLRWDAGVSPRGTVIIVHGAGADRCVAPRGSAEFAAAAPPTVVKPRPWPGLAHEIFNEPERDEVLADLLRWLDGRGR